MSDLCPICEGSGLRLIEQADGTRAATDCLCRISRRGVRQFEAARIPERYRDCTLDNFVTHLDGNSHSLQAALIEARGFLRSHAWTLDGDGLLITGRVGVGKTHLAVGILQALVSERGVKGLFVHYRDLLKQVQNSYNRSAEATEKEILRPIMEAEVLVLDELGAARPTEWVADTVEHILNTRYNDCRTTIITTNLVNAPPASASYGAAAAASRADTLGDRIGERMRSRLQEMCVVLEMQGEDYRERMRRTSFATEKPRRMRQGSAD